MGSGLSVTDLKAASQSKLDDARLLLRSKRYSNAFYLAGYAVEIGLKACIAKQLPAETLPDPEILRGVLVHDFQRLVGLAGLRFELQAAQQTNSTLQAFWAVVGEWSPEARYAPSDPTSAQLMVEAVGHPTSGVLTWIKKHW